MKCLCVISFSDGFLPSSLSAREHPLQNEILAFWEGLKFLENDSFYFRNNSSFLPGFVFPVYDNFDFCQKLEISGMWS